MSHANKPLIIIGVFMVVLTGIFWYDRYPNLFHKYQGIHKVVLKDALSPDAGIARNSRQLPVAKRTWITFENWLYTNRKGMTYGLLFGAAVLTLFGFLRLSPGRNVFTAALKGMFAGFPLGVCSNCVAPIMQGAAKGGANPASALGLMFASPTLNVLVLTMIFTVLPLPLAILKIAGSLVLILLVVPLFTRRLSFFAPSSDSLQLLVTQNQSQVTWLQAFSSGSREYGRNLWRIVRLAIPFMLIGGFLGSLLVQVMDLSSLASGSGLPALLGLAVVGTFLPVPMAFDIMFGQVLILAGASLAAVMALVSTLGAFSVYSGAMVWRTFGWRMAVGLFAAVSLVGLLSGLLVRWLY